MRLFVRQPRRPSQSAREIAGRLGARLIRRTNSRYRYRSGDRIINWGNPLPFDAPYCAVMNDPAAVEVAINKVLTWEKLELLQVPTVEWTEDWAEAVEWMLRNDERVMVRSILRGSQGRGITVYSRDGTEHSLPVGNFEADGYEPGGVYVKVFGRNPRRVSEFRVAVCNGQVIDYAQKKKRRNREGRFSPYVRSHGNGWVFCREGVELPPALHDAAQSAVEALDLDFGAVDCAIDRSGRVCVYEINTAPGIEGTSHDRWADALGGGW